MFDFLQILMINKQRMSGPKPVICLNNVRYNNLYEGPTGIHKIFNLKIQEAWRSEAQKLKVYIENSLNAKYFLGDQFVTTELECTLHSAATLECSLHCTA